MTWVALFHEAFEAEFDQLRLEIQDEALANMKLLEQFGPRLGRPKVDTLKGSRYSNMKELRFDAANGPWRIAFAFDPNRAAILLVAGDKSGVSQRRFYRQLIAKADQLYDAHLSALRSQKTTKGG